MTLSEFCSNTGLSVCQVTALQHFGLITPDLPSNQVGRARLLQTLKTKGIPLSKLASAKLPDDAAFVVYDHAGGSVHPFADPVRALAHAAACRRACAVVAVGNR